MRIRRDPPVLIDHSDAANEQALVLAKRIQKDLRTLHKLARTHLKANERAKREPIHPDRTSRTHADSIEMLERLEYLMNPQVGLSPWRYALRMDRRRNAYLRMDRRRWRHKRLRGY